MLKNKNIISLLLIILLFISCRHVQDKNSKVDLIKSNQNTLQDTLNSKKEAVFSEKIIARYEFDLYAGNNNILWGEFYSPKTDSLIIFKFIPLNQNGFSLLKKIDDTAGDEFKIRQKLLIQNLNDFKISWNLINYNYVLEQEDAGGSPVFNVKKPFEAQNFTCKDGNVTMSEVKTYQKFAELFQ